MSTEQAATRDIYNIREVKKLVIKVANFQKTKRSDQEIAVDQMVSDVCSAIFTKYNIVDDSIIKKINPKLKRIVYKELRRIGYSIMVKKLEKKQLLKCGDFKSVQKFVPEAKDKFNIFLSAVTNITGTTTNTLEYKLAVKLKEELTSRGYGVFWWDDEEIKRHGWNISTKIAMGLAFSSVFVGLAFDSVSKQDNGCYVYNCLLEGNAAYKTPNFFKYEVDTYCHFISNKRCAYRFVKDIVDTTQYDNFLPKTRKLKFFTYGKPENYEAYPMFNDREDRICTVSEDATDDEIFQQVLSSILDMANSHNAETKYSFLYKIFDPDAFSRGQYCDEFLSPEWGARKDLGWIRDGSKENFEARPADYFFKYAIVDEAGNNAKNHFLVFPERYNDDNGNFKWRIKLVVRDWNLRALQDRDYRLFLLGNKDDNSKPQLDSQFPLSDYSIIEFYKGVKDLSGLSTITISPEHATCQTYSDNRSDAERLTTMNSGVENHCAFILYDDMLNEIQPTYHLTGFLKFCNIGSPNVGKYFYISVNFYPKEAEYNTTKVKSPALHKTETRCPYCGRIRTNDSKFKGNDREEKKKKIACSQYCYSEVLSIGGKCYRSCEYNFIGRFYPLDDGGLMKKSTAIGGREEEQVYGVFSGKLFDDCIALLTDKNSTGLLALDQKDKSKLVYQDYYEDGLVVTMVGKSQSGKSTFVSRMLSVHSEGDYDGDISCDYLSNALKPYVQAVTLMRVKTHEMVLQHRNTDSDMLGINGIRLLEDYKSPKYQKFLRSTQIESYDPILTHIPFAIELEGIQSNSAKKSFVSFFDLPGGLFSKTQDKSQKTLANLHNDYTMLYSSDSIILLLNDDQKDEAELRAMIEAIDNDNVNEETVVAIVFCKADGLFGKQYNWDKIRNSSPVAKDNKFNGSKRQSYIEKCSEEIETAMKSYGSTTIKEIIEKLKKRFKKHHKFFAISALGRGDSIVRKNDDEKYTLYETSPLNIENVLLWIMFEKGIIE